MGNVSKMIVLTQSGQVDTARGFAEQLSNICAQHRHISVDVRTVNDIDLDEVGSFDIALILAASDTVDRHWREVIDAIDEAELPTLAVLEGEIDANNPLVMSRSMIAKASLSITEMAGRLEGLLHQRQVVKRLKAELTIAQRFQGGLRGEISRIHDELQLAAMVQKEFLPRELPELEGVSFGALWRPACYVSGDIYDITRLDEKHIGVFIADAVGHGVPAALMTMVIARAIPTKDISSNQYRIIPPSEALSRLNTEMIQRQGETTRFATAVYGVIDCSTKKIRIASAGHPPPFLIRGDEPMEEVEVSGGLLGVFDDETYEETEIQLMDGDRLLLYSDGFEVAFPEDVTSERGTKMPTLRYIEEFEKLRKLKNPSDMMKEIGDRVDSQPGSLHQRDDLTFICLQVGASVEINNLDLAGLSTSDLVDSAD